MGHLDNVSSSWWVTWMMLVGDLDDVLGVSLVARWWVAWMISVGHLDDIGRSLG